jgi:hypothetical protein
MVLDTDGDRNENQVEDFEFDPKAIPKRRWQEYEDSNWEKPSQAQMDDKTVTLYTPGSTEEPITYLRPSPPHSQHVDVSGTLGNEEYKWIESFPSDQEITLALYNILKTADLMKVTRHQGSLNRV